jgi:uncharacterized protein
MSTQIIWLADHRLHLLHGPIDCIVGAHGNAGEVRAALNAAITLFPDLLPELVAELPRLRAKLGETAPQVLGETAQRMVAACWPHRAQFITPMAAVAGGVADTLLARMLAVSPGLRKAFVNDGGDIALHLAKGETFRVAIADHPMRPAISGTIDIAAAWPVRGVATSGWRGRSQSLGIADAVTVLAANAASADAAATMIANAVNVTDERIERAPAHTVKDDSDLGDLLVTTFVPPLPASQIARALAAGERTAQLLVEAGVIHSAVLQCQGAAKLVGPINVMPLEVHQTLSATLLAA